MNRTIHHVVIVGAGFGGMSAAQALRKADCSVTIIDRTNHHLFQPLLYQVATAWLTPADVSAPVRDVLHRQKNLSVLMGEVTGIVDHAIQVQIDDDTRVITFDTLILATGARHAYFGHDDWEAHAPGLKTLSDALHIRGKILRALERAEAAESEQERHRWLTFVLIGAGPTGVEMAGAIAEVTRLTVRGDFKNIDPRTARVLLVEAGPRILSAFDPSLSEKAQRQVERMGVDVRTGSPVTDVTESGIQIGEESIPAATVIWTAGVHASPAAIWIGVEPDRAGRVRIEPDCSVAGHPNVFVVGDTASLAQDGKPLPGVAQVAIQQGKYVGSLIIERLAGKPKPLPFRYRDKGNMATIGRYFAVLQIGNFKIAGFAAMVAWAFVHIWYLIEFEDRFAVFLRWVWYYLTRKRGSRLIIGD